MAERSYAYDVFQNRYNVTTGRQGEVHIDTVFYDSRRDLSEVRRDLIDHDGYNANIIVRRGKKHL